MIPTATSYTSYTRARDNFVAVLEEVEHGDAIVVVQRRGHADVAMIAADELSGLLEEVYLLRSPANAKRLFAAMDWAQQELSQSPQPQTVGELRSELETEVVEEET